jgi:hypothetical protein
MIFGGVNCVGSPSKRPTEGPFEFAVWADCGQTDRKLRAVCKSVRNYTELEAV